jgi:hypothetical protein
MRSLVERIRAFLRSPQGERAIMRGRQQLANPENQQKLKGLLGRLRGRR